MTLHHIGYLVKNINKSAEAFRAIGFIDRLCDDGSYVCYDPNRMCDICFMELTTGDKPICIELISPKTKVSPIYGLLDKYKNSPYHMCFECEDMEMDMQQLREKGWSVFTQPAAAPAINNRNVVFLIHRSAGIIELVDAR